MEKNKADYLITDSTIIYNIYRINKSKRALKDRIYKIANTCEINEIKPLLIYFYVALEETTTQEELVKMKEENQDRLYKDLVNETVDNTREIIDIYNKLLREPYKNETQITLKAERQYKDLIKARRN